MHILKYLTGTIATMTVFAEAYVGNVDGVQYQRSNQALLMRKASNEPKYFKEPGTGRMGHYDARFFNRVLDYEEQTEALQHLIRSWLRWTTEKNIDTWLAHGTLIGWWWNSKLLPWDSDIDVQISEETLKDLYANYNMTKYSYTSPDEKTKIQYLLDVNPYSTSRVRGNWMNVIDARWIDKSSGMFIDITALSETLPDIRPGIIHCKNFHRYHTDEIYPLRETVFEDMIAKVPYAYEQVLLAEYGTKVFTSKYYEGHRWNARTRVWELMAHARAKYSKVKILNHEIDEKVLLDAKIGLLHPTNSNGVPVPPRSPRTPIPPVAPVAPVAPEILDNNKIIYHDPKDNPKYQYI